MLCLYHVSIGGKCRLYLAIVASMASTFPSTAWQCHLLNTYDTYLLNTEQSGTSNNLTILSARVADKEKSSQVYRDLPLSVSSDLIMDVTSSIDEAAKFEKPTTNLHQYVSRPRRQKHQSYMLPTLIVIVDTLLTLAPCLFLILAFEAFCLNQTPISQHGQTIEQAAKLGPTLFPIIFAAIVGRLMRTYALWRAERGATIGTLEALNGSQNLLAAAERVIRLPGLGILGFAIILLWMLSPVGGQSSLRVISRASASVSERSNIYYFNTTGNSTTGAFGDSLDFSWDTVPMKAIFDATLLSLQKVKGNDLWNNIKIPYIDQVPSFITGNSTDGWYPFSEDDYNATYSALNGIVVSGLDMGYDTDFTLTSSYFNLTCSDVHTFTVGNDTSDNDILTDNTGSNSSSFYGGFCAWAKPTLHNASDCLLALNSDDDIGFSYNSYIIDTSYNFTAKPIPTEFNIIYASVRIDSISAFNCSLGMTQVESLVHCAGTSCELQGIRYAAANSSSSLRDWPFSSTFVGCLRSLLIWLGDVAPLDNTGLFSPVDWFVSGSDTPFQSEITLAANLNWGNVSGSTVAQRLGALLNTGWQLSFQHVATARTPSNNATALAAGSDIAAGGVGYDTIRTDATLTATHDIFVASLVWVSVTLAVAFILLLCGVTSMIFKYGTRAPDILGFVSSMTRDNKNFEPVPGGDRLDGLQLAKKLGNVHVQIVDVEPMGADGYITLVNLDRIV